MNRVVVILCCIAFAGGFFWFFPLFHVERVDSTKFSEAARVTDTRELAATFWEKQLVPAMENAPEGEELISALADNVEAARRRFGHKVGIGRTTLFTVKGQGRVVAVDKSGVGIALKEGSDRPEILLQTGLLFGNTVRDSTGLIAASDFQDSRQFNEVSTELNRIVETEVILRLKENAFVGKRVRFVGCVEIADRGEFAIPLSIIPMQVEFE
jgi:predicted lipoprotein